MPISFEIDPFRIFSSHLDCLNPMTMFPHRNNLQWLRLMFAAQVVVVHSAEHLGGDVPDWLAHFPGVPAFFFVSGFLIYSTYRANDGRDYWRNRLLRLFPALLVVTLAAAAVVLIAHGWRDLIENPGTYISWFGAQLTLGQAYNPDHFRDVGVGVLNGSLWTITTEILFYICVPVIVWLERRWRWTVPALIVGSFAVYVFGPSVLSYPLTGRQTLYDAVALTPVAWGWMFGFGMLAVRNFERLARLIRFLPLAILPMLLMIWVGDGPLFGTEGNRLGLVYFACYTAVITWLAFGTPFLRLQPDFSYGAYVWHMPIINLLLVLALPYALPTAFAATAITAALSWYLVERPALSLKRRSIHPVSDLQGEGHATGGLPANQSD